MARGISPPPLAISWRNYLWHGAAATFYRRKRKRQWAGGRRYRAEGDIYDGRHGVLDERLNVAATISPSLIIDSMSA